MASDEDERAGDERQHVHIRGGAAGIECGQHQQPREPAGQADAAALRGDADTASRTTMGIVQMPSAPGTGRHRL